MKKTLHLVLSLSLISAVCAAILATVNAVTKEQIATLGARAVENAARAVMTSGVAEVRPLADGLYAGLDRSGGAAAYAVVGSDAHGFGGEIRLMVGFRPDYSIVTYRKLAASETPGLGTKLSSPEFVGQFEGRSAANALKVTKDGGEIEAITSATITSRAVCAAVNAAKGRLAAHLTSKKQGE